MTTETYRNAEVLKKHKKAVKRFLNIKLGYVSTGKQECTRKRERFNLFTGAIEIPGYVGICYLNLIKFLNFVYYCTF